MNADVWLFILTAILLTAGSVAISFDCWPFIIIATLVYIAIGWFIGALSLAWIGQHPLQALAVPAAYLAIGSVWMVFRWWRFVKRRCRQYAELKASSAKINASDEAFAVRWRSIAGYGDQATVPPQVSANKGMLLGMLSFWPFSMLSYIFADLLRDVFATIFRRLSCTMQRISDSVFKGQV